jgi:hypothetical protein
MNALPDPAPEALGLAVGNTGQNQRRRVSCSNGIGRLATLKLSKDKIKVDNDHGYYNTNI